MGIENKNPLDALNAWMEQTGDATLDDLREIRREMGHDVERSEREFLTSLRQRLSHIPEGSRQEKAAPAEGESIQGIISEGTARGFTSTKLASAVGLSLTLLTKLDRRMIRFQSIPEEVIGRLAGTLERSTAVVAEYLMGGGPRFVSGALYKASSAPVLPPQQDFYEAVVSDRTLKPEERSALLALSKPGS